MIPPMPRSQAPFKKGGGKKYRVSRRDLTSSQIRSTVADVSKMHPSLLQLGVGRAQQLALHHAQSVPKAAQSGRAVQVLVVHAAAEIGQKSGVLTAGLSHTSSCVWPLSCPIEQALMVIHMHTVEVKTVHAVGSSKKHFIQVINPCQLSPKLWHWFLQVWTPTVHVLCRQGGRSQFSRIYLQESQCILVYI